MASFRRCAFNEKKLASDNGKNLRAIVFCYAVKWFLKILTFLIVFFRTILSMQILFIFGVMKEGVVYNEKNASKCVLKKNLLTL